MKQIEISGIELLNEEEKEIVDKLFSEKYKKIQRMIKNDISLKINIKEYKKEGKRKKYSIDVGVFSSFKKIFKANAFDWELARTIHKVLNKLTNEIEHQLHISEQH